jgi:hypothetical protein
VHSARRARPARTRFGARPPSPAAGCRRSPRPWPRRFLDQIPAAARTSHRCRRRRG